VALKVAEKANMTREQLNRTIHEAEILASLRGHPNIVQLVDAFDTPNEFCIAMQYAPGGDLLSIIQRGRLTESRAKLVFAQLCNALVFSHQRGIIHRDVKLENLLVDEHGDVLLGDWGFAGRWSPDSSQSEFFGSLHYAGNLCLVDYMCTIIHTYEAPEILLGKPYIGPEVDAWSCVRYRFLLRNNNTCFFFPLASAICRCLH
jgi:serine/threonine protein kinase